jgi:hypothetical protein
MFLEYQIIFQFTLTVLMMVNKIIVFLRAVPQEFKWIVLQLKMAKIFLGMPFGTVKSHRFWLGCRNENSYAALRFSKSQSQTWGLNFMREIKEFKKIHLNYVDNKIGAVIKQEF